MRYNTKVEGITFLIGILFMGFFISLVNTTEAEMGHQVPTDKKLIAFAPNTVDAVYLRENIKEIEELPIDGMIISVFPDKWDIWGKTKRQPFGLWFGGMKFTKEDFKQAIADLKTTKFKRFTDNFIAMGTTVPAQASMGFSQFDRFIHPGFLEFDKDIGRKTEGIKFEKMPEVLPNPDWFKDEEWARVVDNAKVISYIAKTGKFKGIMLDWEQYGGVPGPWARPFGYSNYSNYIKEHGGTQRSFVECRAKIRERGREFMEAITSVYPDITIILIPCGGYLGGGQEGDRDDVGLIAGFIDGMVEGAGEKATLIDGYEGSYGYLKYGTFLRARQAAEWLDLKASQIPVLYAEKMKYANAVWIDREKDFYGDGHIRARRFSEDTRSPEELEHALYNALTVSDKYVWLFAWGGEDWFNPSLRRKYGYAPQEYRDALKNCRKPHDLNWSPLKKDLISHSSAKEEPCYDDESTFGSLWDKYELVMDLPEVWGFQFDEEMFGSGMGWEEDFSLPRGGIDFGREKSDWQPIRIGEWWERQGYPYDGMGWYRVIIKVPEEVQGKKLFLSFGGVAGAFYGWVWNKHRAGELPSHGRGDREQKSRNERFEVEGTNLLEPGEDNLIIVRVYNYQGPGGIWKSVKLIAAKE